MPDALLKSCRISDSIYSLAGPLSRGSLRDSMWKAQTLCERLFVNGRVAKGDEVLVVGGGVSGMLCTLALLAIGAKVTVVERSSRLASRQADCPTRGVCPTCFDFPYAHWKDGYYPIAGRRSKMRWRRSLASEAHAQWVKIFNRRIRTKAHRVQILIDAQITKFTGSGSSVTATIEGTDYLFNPSTVSFTKEFQIAILCVGFGDENRSIKGSDFVSHGFWDGDDPLLYFEEPRLCAEFASQPVLIGGGGDGALGDFITLLTGKRHFSEVIKSLRFTAKDRDGIHRLRMMLNTYYQLGGAKSEHRMLTKVQEEGILLADSMWARSNMKNAVRALLRPLDERPFVQLAMQCHHFSFGYVANRVVAHLLALGLSEDLEALNGGIAPFRLAVRVSKIYGVHGHTCESNKKTCLTGWHHVEFTERNCEGVSSLPEFVDCRRFDRDASRQLAEHPVFTLDNRPKDFRRVLLRFGSPVPEVDTFQNNYCLPPAVAEAAADPNRFRLITPFYPV